MVMFRNERGGEFYDQPGVMDAYLRARHASVSSPNVVMEEPAFLDAIGHVKGLDVVDLGCGDGSFSLTLLDLGVRSYLGIDGSSAMIREASSITTAEAVGFTQRDIEDLDLVAESVDLITARMSLHYVEDIAAVIRASHRALTSTGRLVFSVVHPVITSFDNAPEGPRTSWTVDDYFNPGPRVRQWFDRTVTWHHRTIEQYVNSVVGAGFRLELLSECEPQKSLFAGNELELERRRRVPLVLLIAATKTGSPMPTRAIPG